MMTETGYFQYPSEDQNPYPTQTYHDAENKSRQLFNYYGATPSFQPQPPGGLSLESHLHLAYSSASAADQNANSIVGNILTSSHMLPSNQTSNSVNAASGVSNSGMGQCWPPANPLGHMVFDPTHGTSPSIARAIAVAQNQKRPRSEKKPIPKEQQDNKYFERRKRNNQAAKKSRDARKSREDDIAIRASFLEKENAILRAQTATLREEANSLKQLLLQKTRHRT